MSKADTRTVELYIGFPDFTWATDYVDIPADTPEDKIGEEAITAMAAELNRQGTEAAFVGLYNVPEIEDRDTSEGAG